MKKYNIFASIAVIIAVINAAQTAPTYGNYTTAVLAMSAALVCLVVGSKTAAQ